MAICLLLEESSVERLSLKMALQKLGLIVQAFATDKDAIEAASVQKFDLVLCGQGTSETDSLSFVANIRAQSNVPILAILESDSERDISKWLDAGVDDYISRPINQRLLTARILQQQKRSNHNPKAAENALVFGPLRLEPQKHEFLVHEAPVALTSAEFQILGLLMENPDRVFSREQILETLGITPGEGTNQMVDTHASRIRKKIRSAGGPEVMKAVRSVGFRLSPPISNKGRADFDI
jgi:DNA-binding response OmpR family regulator